MTEWSLNPIFNSYGLVALLVAGMAVLLIFRPTFGRLTNTRRGVLIALRLAVVGLLVLAMLRPTRVFTTVQQQSAVLLLLLDQSRSMTLPSATEGKSRWLAQRELLEKLQEPLARLPAGIELRLYAYDNQLHPVTFAGGKIQLPPQPVGDQTDIGTALHDAVQRELGKRLLATILLGDGAQTAFTPRVEIPEAGRELARLAYPLYTVTLGPAGDVAAARDVAVENLPEQYTVFVKNELVVKGAVRVRGYVNQQIPLELLVEGPTGGSTRVGTTQIVARDDNVLLPVEFSFTPSDPGQYKLTLQAAAQAGELVVRNNQLTAFVTVLEGGLRVLYLYGDLLGEQRLLRRSLNLSPDLQLDDIFIDPKNRERWPIPLEEELNAANLDVLLIENVPAAALGPTNWRAIATLVDRGKGCMMIGGFNSFGPGGYRDTPLADVLPIEMGRFESQDFGLEKPISRDLHWWGKLQPWPVAPHPVTTLAVGPDDNVQTWKSLPPLDGANKFAGIKPRARVLLEADDGKPILAAGEYGGGRVLAFGGESSWRWWQHGRQSEHRRFWRQVVLWLARRDDLEQHDVWIKLAQRRFNPGSEVTFTAGARSATGEVMRDADLSVELVSPNGSRQPLRVSQDGEAHTGALADLTLPGDYLLELTASRQGQPLGTARANFQILDRDAELSSPAAGHEQMARLANLTREAGGQPLAPEQLPGLLRDLQDRREELQVEVQTKWQLGDTALDAWLFFLAVVALLTAEWALRKRWGLV